MACSLNSRRPAPPPGPDRAAAWAKARGPRDLCRPQRPSDQGAPQLPPRHLSDLQGETCMVCMARSLAEGSWRSFKSAFEHVALDKPTVGI